MSIKGKNNRSLRKKTLPNTRNTVTGVKSVKFHHEANFGDIYIDIANLNVPSGFINPSPVEMVNVKLKELPQNLILTSSARGSLMEGLSYEILSNTTIKLLFESYESEIFTGLFQNHITNGQLIADVRPDGDSGTLLEAQTDFNLGTPVLIEDENNQWPIQVFRGNDGKPMLRNYGNGDSDGNYKMIDNGTGYCQIIRFNVAGDINDEPIFWATHGSLAERPQSSVLQQVDNINGVLDIVKDDLLEITGFDVIQPTRYSGAPAQADLKAFGDRVLLLEKILNIDIESSTVQYYSMTQLGNAMLDRTSEVEFNLATATIKENGDTGIITASNVPTQTRWTANKACVVGVRLTGKSATVNNQFRVERYNSSVAVLEQYTENSDTAVDRNSGSYVSFTMNVGDFFVARTVSDIQNTADIVQVSFTATAKTTTKVKDLI